MNEDEFWILIEKTKQMSDGSIEEQTQLLIQELEEYPDTDIFQFDQILIQKQDEAYIGTLWDVCDFITCSGGEQNFIDFRAWLISQGKAIYDHTISDPDSLYSVVTRENREDILYEEFSYVSIKAYERKTGKILPSKGPFAGNPKGKQMGGQMIAERFPKLYSRLGDCPDL